jgi:zinc/manganese transport system ATP-binding protein
MNSSANGSSRSERGAGTIPDRSVNENGYQNRMMGVVLLSPHPPPLAARVRDVRVTLDGRHALRGVDLDIPAAAVTAVTGANGSGKSTLLEVIAGTRRPVAGTRSVVGVIAFVPQRVDIPDRLPVTVRDVVTVGAWGRVGAWRRLGADARGAVGEALRLLDLRDIATQPFAALSGGQRQRTLLAQGIARGGDVLLLDEPTTALDVESAERIRAVIRAQADGGAAVVCVTHDRAVTAAADIVVRLSDGRVAAAEEARGER